jgi:hypothetical protein
MAMEPVFTEQGTNTLAYSRGGFARDFATADGERVMVAALTRQQFADLGRTTRLTRTFASLERVLHADFSAADERVGEPVQGVPRDPVHPLHAGRPQRRHHHVSHRGRHLVSSIDGRI